MYLKSRSTFLPVYLFAFLILLFQDPLDPQTSLKDPGQLTPGKHVPDEKNRLEPRGNTKPVLYQIWCINNLT